MIMVNTNCKGSAFAGHIWLRRSGGILTILKCTGGPPKEVKPRYQFSRMVFQNRPPRLAVFSRDDRIAIVPAATPMVTAKVDVVNWKMVATASLVPRGQAEDEIRKKETTLRGNEGSLGCYRGVDSGFEK